MLAVFTLAGLAYLVRGVLPLITLLVEDGSSDVIHYTEIDHEYRNLSAQVSQLIPRMIHQTYKSEIIPDSWVDLQRSCLDMHPDFEYIVGI